MAGESTARLDRAEDTHAPRRFQVRGLRWWIVGLVALATVINYVDRQTVNVLSPILLRDLGLTKIEFSRIAAVFLGAYTIGMAVWGRLFDRLGSRVAFAVAIALWSAAATLHAFVGGFLGLAIARALLGFGEAGNWPGAAKVASEWFPARERALAFAIFNGGASLGAVVSAPIIGAIQLAWGWQPVFVITGLVGFVWLIGWWVVYRSPDRHPWLGAEERALLEPPVASKVPQAAPRWGELLRRRQVWAVVLARLCTDPIWWLYLVWLPQYLHDARGFDMKQISASAWVPYLFAGIGALSGGWLSGHLMRRGLTLSRARKVCLLIGAALMPAGLLITRAANPMTALVLVGVVLFAFQFWMNNLQALPGDFFPAHTVGAVFGLGGAAAGIGSLTVMLLSGPIVQHLGYGPVLAAAGVLAPLGAILLFLLAGRIERVSA